MASTQALAENQRFDSRSQTARRSVLSKIVANPVGLLGLSVTVLFILIAIFAPLLAPHDPGGQNLSLRLLPPAWQAGGKLSYILGADALGRDLLSRVIEGSRISLLVGFSSVFIGAVVGVAVGLVSGARGGFVDTILMRIGDVQLAFPPLILAIAIMAVFGQGLLNIILVLSISGWIQYARIVRGRALSLRSADYITAARAIGVGEGRIMLRHILPNVMAPIIVIASFVLPQVIIAEASLSFLGIGVPPSTPTWGNMLADSRDYIATAWWLSVWPGLALMLCLLGITVLGDALRDALDPRLKNL
ncbi:MAG TPA: ABC transporter permease [Thermomicrobiaceae bacterium]|nr:ABC transporter permease [Thermomicrobiaceae bacterium]